MSLNGRGVRPSSESSSTTTKTGDLTYPLEGASQLRDSAGFSPDFAAYGVPRPKPKASDHTDRVARLPGEMTSGKTASAISIDLPEGTHVTVHPSVEAWRMATAFLEGPKPRE